MKNISSIIVSVLFCLFAVISSANLSALYAQDFERDETTHFFNYIGTPLETDLEVDFSELTSDMVAYSSGTTHSETLLEFQHIGLYKYCYDPSSRTVDEVAYTAPRAWNSCSSIVNGAAKRNDTIAAYYHEYDRCAMYFPEMKYGIRYIVVEGWSYTNPSNIVFKKQNSDGSWTDIASSSQSLKANSLTDDTLFINSRNIKRIMFYRGNTQHQKFQFITKVKVVTYEKQFEAAADGYTYIGTPVDSFSVDFTTWTADSLPISWLDADGASEAGGMAFIKWTSNRVRNSTRSVFNNGTTADATPVRNNSTSNKPCIYLPKTSRGVKTIRARIASSSAVNLKVKYKDTNHGTWSYNSTQILTPSSTSWEITDVSLDLNTIGETSICLFYESTPYFEIYSIELEMNNPLVEISESEDNSSVLSTYNGETVDLRVSRTIKGGMYNTICLPCTVSVSNLKAALGVEQLDAKWFNDASMDDGVLDMQFTTTSTLQAGAPYLIQTDADVTEPFMLEGVTVKNTTRHIDKPADSPLVKFWGIFNPTNMTASQNKLVLGSDDTLYYIDHNLTMQGMRGYFQLTGSAAAAAPPVRIHYSENTATDFDDEPLSLSDEVPLSLCTKVLRNGQIYLIRDGVMYNSLGQTLQK